MILETASFLDRGPNHKSEVVEPESCIVHGSGSSFLKREEYPFQCNPDILQKECDDCIEVSDNYALGAGFCTYLVSHAI